MQINRLFEIVYILLDKKNVTAGELAAHFGVSRRTICRDLDALSTAGIPIYTERGQGGGVRLFPGFVLNKSILSEEEQSEILSALNGLASIKTEDTGRTLQKLSTIFSKTTTNWLEVDYSGWSHENDFFNAFKTAIEERRIIEFEYYNSYGGKTFRRVEPIQVRFKSKAWYVKGYCLSKQGVRLYKVSRIKNLLVTSEVFLQRDLVEEPENAGSCEGPDVVRVKLRIAPERVYRVFDDFHESMAEKQPDGSFIVTVAWPENDWLYDFILSYGTYIEVLEPAHLQAVIKEKAQKISNKYL